MKKHLKIIFITAPILIVASFIVLICVFVWAKPIVKNNLKYWKNNDYSDLYYGERLSNLLPEYGDGYNYTDANFYYHQGLSFTYAEAAYCLELYLDEAEYNNSKLNAQSNFNYFSEASFEKENLSLSDYGIGDFNVYVINDGKWDTFRKPSEIKLIAFNDGNRCVRYCYVVNTGLDYLDDEADFSKWIVKNFNLKW